MAHLKSHVLPAQGSIREMVAISLPMVVSHACYTVMTFTDRIFLSRLGPEVMSAAMAGGLTAFMMMTFFVGLTGYATALVAQYLGAGYKQKCAVTITQSLIIAVIAWPVIVWCRPLAYRLFDMVGINPVQLIHQKIYFDILVAAVIVGLLRHVFSSFFSGIGKTKIVMISSFVAMVVNIVANYILIFGKLGVPALGIRGAAYGTVIGLFCGCIVLVGTYFNSSNRKEYGITGSFRFDRNVMGTLVRFGYPAGVEMFLNLVAFDVMVMIFHSVSLIAATASTIMFNWDMVSFVPLLGVEIGTTSLVGRYMGASSPDTAHRAAMSGFKMGCVYSAVVFIFFVGFPGLLVDVFQPAGADPVFLAARSTAIFMIRLASVYVLVESMFVVFTGALRGAGDTFWAMCLSVTLHWILVPAQFVMLKVYRLPLETGWSVLVAIFLFFSVFVYFRYRSGHWRTIKVVEEPVSVIETAIDGEY
ncbi:MAG: MATE family efflux transporter [Candidatus Omnitrophica bacterium]|nr:MATE family efflux transporter [Candidatus Omnitrophota bacterium]